MKRLSKTLAGAAVALIALSGCVSDADKVSENLSTEAEQFQVQRRIVGINTFTDEYLFHVEGRCSIEVEGTDGNNGRLVAICKHNDDDYRKHYVGLSDNTAWVVEQMEGIDVSEYRTKIILKPENILPTIDIETSAGED